MRLIIGLIVFWITIFGIKLFLEDKTKIDNKFSFALSFTVIGLIEFILGIINMMKIGSLLIVLFSIFYIGYLIINKRIEKNRIIEYIKEPTNIICFLIFTYITIVGLNMHLTHYDNFSHWGLIIKTMFQYNRLPNFENNYILFKGYQPGSACFAYFVGLLCGKNEGVMIVAQNYLIFSYLSVLFNYIGKEKRILKSLLLVCFYIFIMTTSKIRFNNLLVDSLIAVQLIYGLAIIYNYKDNLKKAALYSLPIAVYLLVVKNTGLILAGIMCLYILYLAFKQRKLKEGIKYVIIIGTVLLVTLLIWQNHVSLVYGHWALNTKHSLSPQNFYSSIKALGIDNMKLFIVMYTKHFFSLKNNLTNIYLLIFNIVSLLSLFLVKNKKEVLKFILVLDFIYIGYYILLGLMYIFSMPWNEAKDFAGYERYMMTIVNLLIGLFILFIFNYKEKIKIQNIYLIILGLVLLIPIHYEYDTFTGLIGNDGYEDSKIAKFDCIKEYVPLDKDTYYIYAPSSKGDMGLLHHITIYELCKEDVHVINDKEAIKDIVDNSYIVIYDDIDNTDELFNEEFTRINDRVLSK